MKKILYITLFLIVLCIILTSGYKIKEIIKLNNSINLAKNYIINNINTDGRFIYLRNIKYPEKYSTKKYNILRHAGTLYSMRLYEEFTNNSEDIQAKRILGARYLIDNYIEKLPNGTYTVVSKSQEEDTVQDEAKVGGAGLTLAGISDLYDNKIVSKEILIGLGNFILYMQLPDGSIYSKYNMKNNAPDNTFISLYYPGEAALGLLYLNEVIPDKKWVDGAKKTLLYLANLRKDQNPDRLVFDHWAMLATAKLFETSNNTITEEERELLTAHAEKMAKVALTKQITELGAKFRGAHKNNIRPCSIATFIEGMAAIYNISEDKKLKKQIKRYIILGNRFLEDSQIKNDETVTGGLPAYADWKTNKHKRASIIRIDNVQHAMSAWITSEFVYRFSI